jgi:predicted phosphodiesterase
MHGHQAMLHAILSDIHANYPALVAVMDDARRLGARNVVCLGDMLGYHAFALETLDLIREHDVTCVAGNHDLMAVGRIPTSRCGPRGRAAIDWTRSVLRPDDVAFISALPTMRLLDEGTILVHSLPWSTETRMREDHDFSEAAALCVHGLRSTRRCFTGHTHQAMSARVSDRGHATLSAASPLRRTLDEDAFWFVNPGSVGEPRDGRPGARYALYNDASRCVRFRRVPYDAAAVRRRDADCGLDSFAERPRRRAVQLAYSAARAAGGMLFGAK